MTLSSQSMASDPRQHRPPTLSELLADVQAAREEVRSLRGAPMVPDRLRSARQVLLQAMEAYAAGLTARRLPIPPQLRDEIRLQRRIRTG